MKVWERKGRGGGKERVRLKEAEAVIKWTEGKGLNCREGKGRPPDDHLNIC